MYRFPRRSARPNVIQESPSSSPSVWRGPQGGTEIGFHEVVLRFAEFRLVRTELMIVSLSPVPVLPSQENATSGRSGSDREMFVQVRTAHRPRACGGTVSFGAMGRSAAGRGTAARNGGSEPSGATSAC
jgi:hypothetical protein